MAFGDFRSICNQATVPLCNLIDSGDDSVKTGVVSKCYSRSIDLANTVIFQIGNAFINIGALVLVMMIIFNIKSKFTAIGRQEMLYFYSLFFVLTALSIINDCGVAPPGSAAYAWLVTVQNSFVSASCWTLMINGFLGFELWEDGKKRSLMLLQLSSAAIFVLTFVISAFTFTSDTATVGRSNTVGLFVVLYLFNAIFVFVYVVSQILLCLYVLKNVWALGAIFIGVFFFVVAQILIYVLSDVICEGANHYLDGLFFGTLSNTFAVMMLYKYWDIITAEDLEFSVSNREDGVAVFGDYSDKVGLTGTRR